MKDQMAMGIPMGKIILDLKADEAGFVFCNSTLSTDQIVKLLLCYAIDLIFQTFEVKRIITP